MIAQTERLILRRLTLDDADDIVTLLNQPSFIANIGDKQVRNHDDALKYLSEGPIKMYEDLGFGMFAVILKNTQQFIGMCGLIKRDGIERPEIGYSLIETHQGKGLGKESCYAVLDHARNDLKLKKLQAITNPNNEISIKLLVSLGFGYLSQVTLPQGDLVNLYELTLNQ